MPIAQIMDDYSGYVRELLEADARLLPHSAGYPDFLQRRLSAGHAFLDRRLPVIRHSAPDHFERLSRIAGQGIVMAEELLLQWCTLPEDCLRAIDACALLNLLIASFDQVIDNRPSSAKELRNIMNRRSIIAALHTNDLGVNSSIFGHERIMDPVVSFVAGIGEMFFAECRGFRLQNKGRVTWAYFTEVTLEAYDAELATVDLPVRSDNALIRALDRKAALPGALIAIITLLCSRIRLEIDPAAAIEVMEAVGRLSGKVDDLCDLADDIRSGQMNSLLLAVGDALPMERQSWKASELLEALVVRGVLAQCVLDIGLGLNSLLAQHTRLFSSPQRFQENVRHWLSSWFV